MSITTNEYFELQTLGLARKSIRAYFSTLISNSYLKIIDKDGRSNIYDVNKSALNNTLLDLKNLDDTIFDDITRQYWGDNEILNIIKKNEYVDGLSVMNNCDDVPVPEWIKRVYVKGDPSPYSER